MLKSIINFLRRLFFKKNKVRIGFFGATNVGKTTLANRISMDLTGQIVGNVSPIPHETRTVQIKNNVELKSGPYSLVMNILDMPGIAVKVDYRDFMEYGLSKKEAQQRAKEATRGIIEAIKTLDEIDAALIIMDATEEPYNQINVTLIGNLEAKNIPFIIVANKIDLPDANPQKIRDTFPNYPIVEVSAATGQNIEMLYDELAVQFL
ncbi:MAG: Era-like GTP-binding protein [Candidatus Micrarchaeota archaeon]|nr:Era-like GTP-binding protein [Candidatus Micrarchaeota archaeon]